MSQGRMQNMGGFPGGGGPGNGAQANPDIQNRQIMRFIIGSIEKQPPRVGWRVQVDPQERVHWIKQVYVSAPATFGEFLKADTCILKHRFTSSSSACQ
jgi:hypothetical protein